jgi:hypothetical protein
MLPAVARWAMADRSAVAVWALARQEMLNFTAKEGEMKAHDNVAVRMKEKL